MPNRARFIQAFPWCSNALAAVARLALLFVIGLSLQAQSSSKDYIYLGGRLIAIENPNELVFAPATIPTSGVENTAFSPAIQVQVQDGSGNVVTSSSAQVTLSSSSNALGGTTTASAQNGVAVFNNVYFTAAAGPYNLAASASGMASATISSITISASGGPAVHFSVAPTTPTSSVPSGSTINWTVEALNQSNSQVTTYSGSVKLSSSDTQAQFSPNPVTMSSGSGSFTATLKTAGTQTITATDTAGNTGTSASISVVGSATHLAVTGVPASTASGASFSFTVTALDQNNNTVTNYPGTVKFSSSDSAATLPGNTTLTSGTEQFSAVLKTAGMQTITATDTVTSTITGTSASVSVGSGATHLAVTMVPTSVNAGTAVPFTVTAEDQNNNTVTSFSGTVSITSTDSAATFPASLTLSSGTVSSSVTFETPGSRTLSATAGSLTGTSAPIIVIGPATHLAISVPSSVTSETSFPFSVTALDVNNNLATTYTATVSFSSGDKYATLPASTTLNSGAGSFQATLVTPGNQYITATTSTFTVTSPYISVAPLPLAITSPSDLGVVVVTSSYPQGVLQLNANGGTQPYTWTLASGSVPPGLTFNSNGAITGVPTQPQTVPQTFTFTATVTDSSSPALTQTQTFSIEVVSIPTDPEVTPFDTTVYVGQSVSYTWTAPDTIYNWTQANEYLAFNVAPTTDNWYAQYGACWVEYHPYTQTVILYPNSSSGSLQSGALNSGETLSNSQCSVTLSGTETLSPVLGGTTASVTLPVTFSSTFVGSQQMYVVEDLNNEGTSINPGYLTIAHPTVTVSPAAVALTSNQTQQFSATLPAGVDSAVSWSISPATTDSISTTGFYTPPPAIPAQRTVTVTATSLVDPTRSNTATVTLTPPPQNQTITTTISPSTLCQALNTLTINGGSSGVTVSGNVTCSAGKQIIILPNFTAIGSSGTTFIAVINPSL